MEKVMSFHNRRSIRLKGFDYTRSGLYFITVCTQKREHLFGEVVGGEMVLNSAGKMIEKWWLKLSEKYTYVKLDQFIIMPNHIHGIIEIDNNPVGAIPCNPPIDVSIKNNSFRKNQIGDKPIMNDGDGGENMVSPLRGIGQYVSWFKRMSTNEYIKMVKQGVLKPFDKRVWQRNYWEHIIRNEKEYSNIANYIINNSKKWEMDKLNGGVGNIVSEFLSEYGE